MTSSVHIVSIHDATDSDVLSFDLRDVLAALGRAVEDLCLALHSLDATGAAADDISARIAAAGRGGLWLTRRELEALAAGIEQSIDLELVAYPEETDRGSLTAADVELAQFPTNRMVLAILAVDSSYFEVYAKDEALVVAVERHFRDVRREPTGEYF